MIRPTRCAIALASALLLGPAACHRQGSGIEPAYEGCVTDENWVTMDDFIGSNRVKTDPQAGPQWIEPMAGATLPSSSPAVFRFQPSAANAGSPNGDATCPQFQPSRFGGLNPVHLPAVSGTIFDLQFTVDGAVAYRVLTSRQFASVPAATWSGWAGKRVSVALHGARMLKNEVVEGPYRAMAREVQISP